MFIDAGGDPFATNFMRREFDKLKPGDTICIRSWMWRRNTLSGVTKRARKEYPHLVITTRCTGGYSYLFATYPTDENEEKGK